MPQYTIAFRHRYGLIKVAVGDFLSNIEQANDRCYRLLGYLTANPYDDQQSNNNDGKNNIAHMVVALHCLFVGARQSKTPSGARNRVEGYMIQLIIIANMHISMLSSNHLITQ